MQMHNADARQKVDRMSTNDLFKRTGSGDFSKFLKVMVSGPPKSGKTTLLGTVPNILVLDTEPHANNLDSIAHLDLPYATITNTEDLRHILMILGNDSLRKQMAQGTYGIPDIGAVAIDTLDTLQKLMKTERMKEQKSSQFLRDDWGWLKTEMENLVQAFTALPMHVFFMVHVKTQEIGKGDDAYSTVLPGLEGSIAQSIAGMVGYSLLSFRTEEIAPDGKTFTKYWLRTEGDRTHDFLGTRTAGRLPSVIEPDMAAIYRAVMAGRPKKPAQPPAAATPPPASPANDPAVTPPAAEEVAQNPSQAPEVATEVQTRVGTGEPAGEGTAAPADGTPAVADNTPPPAEKPAADEPMTPAAMGHVKRVYEAVNVAFPMELVEAKTVGEARDLVKYWRAIQQDAQEGKGQPGKTPVEEMVEVMGSLGWIPAEGAEPPAPAKVIEPKVDGTIEEVQAYITGLGDGVDLERVQEAYDLESMKGDQARATLMKKLEGYGAKPSPEPTPDVQTDVETPAEAVTPETPAADTSSTESTEKADREAARDAEAVKAVEEGLGGEVIEEGINPDALCEVCGKKVDDLDLAELGMKRFNKMLCVSDYVAHQKK